MKVLKRDSKATWIVATSLCSTCMMITNKVILNRAHFPLSLTLCQLFAAFALTSPKLLSTGFTKIDWRGVSLYVLEAMLFALSLYANLQTLMRTSVGTVIVGRSVVPLLTLMVERFLPKNAPGMKYSSRRLISLLSVILFSVLYAMTDGKLHVSHGLDALWLILWVCLVATQMVYGKWLISAVALGRLERVFYTNSCALPFMIGFSAPELLLIRKAGIASNKNTFFLVVLSCIVGCAISYSSWRLRELVSATTFGLVGVVNKMVTICVSVLIWPNSFSWRGIFAIVGCVYATLFYS